jgi:hypothetical protein
MEHTLLARHRLSSVVSLLGTTVVVSQNWLISQRITGKNDSIPLSKPGFDAKIALKK